MIDKFNKIDKMKSIQVNKKLLSIIFIHCHIY